MTVIELLKRHSQYRWGHLAEEYPGMDEPAYWVKRVFISGKIANVSIENLTESHIDDCIRNCAGKYRLNAHTIKNALSELQNALAWAAEGE